MADPMTPATPPSVPLSSIPIPSRPPKSSALQTTLFALYFNTCIFLLHTLQWLGQPLRFFPSTKPRYHTLIEWTKGAFAKVLVSMTQFFAPSDLVVSFRDADGNLLDPAQYVELDQEGIVKKINLPKRSIWISNHQVYTDWLYLWILSYYCGFEESIIIIMKESLKWVPVVGIAMQFFDFIFLARSWAKDKITLSRQLTKLAHHSQRRGKPLMLLIYPEGTLVSKLTRPTSKKFADKTGIEDCRNLLLPRSTGLLYCARTLKKEIEELKLIDVTIGYPGIPADGYGQSYYTLQSIYMQGVAPPAVHITITVRSISSQGTASDGSMMPIGSISSRTPKPASTVDADVASEARKAEEEQTEITNEANDEERGVFEAWLLERWREKDRLMDNFYADGDFLDGRFTGDKAVAGEYYRETKTKMTEQIEKSKADQTKYYVRVRCRVKSLAHIGECVGWFIPIILGWILWKCTSIGSTGMTTDTASSGKLVASTVSTTIRSMVSGTQGFGIKATASAMSMGEL